MSLKEFHSISIGCFGIVRTFYLASDVNQNMAIKTFEVNYSSIEKKEQLHRLYNRKLYDNSQVCFEGFLIRRVEVPIFVRSCNGIHGKSADFSSEQCDDCFTARLYTYEYYVENA